LLFSVESIPYRKGLRKLTNRVTFFEDAIKFEINGECDMVALEDVFDIYIQEPVTEEIEYRTTNINFFDEGEEMSFELDDYNFKDISYQIEKLLDNNWYNLAPWHRQKKETPDTVKWFNACNAIVYTSSGVDIEIFGGTFITPESIVSQKKVLYDSWEINGPRELMAILPSLYQGRAVADYREEIENLARLERDRREFIVSIDKTCGEQGIWAWDLQRLILLSSLGYICGYIRYETALECCLAAGEKLQSLFSSWDDFAQSYIMGYSYWSDEDPDDEDEEAYERRQIYEKLKKLPHGPFHLAWNYPLTREWEIIDDPADRELLQKLQD
jgi:hypothetical protein